MIRQGWCWRLIALVMFMAPVLSPVMPAMAEGINLLADLEYQQAKSTVTSVETNVAHDSDSVRLSQLYFVDIMKEFSETLIFRAGGNFERDDTDTTYDGARTESSSRSTQPFAELNLTNPLYNLGTAYREVEREETISAGEAPIRNFLEAQTAVFNWKPTELPRLSMNYTRTRAHDEPLTTDAENRLFSLSSRYDYQHFLADYQYSRQEDSERLHDTGSETISSNGGLRYSQRFIDNRLATSGSVRLSQTAIQFSGTGTNRLRTTSLGSLYYLLDDLEPTGNTNGDFTSVDASHPLTDVNIGRNGVLRQVSAGMDFGNDTELDTVYVLIQEDSQNPDLATPSQISSVSQQLHWQVFVSDDQEVWSERTITSAKYNIFDNRFEIAFAPGADTRFVKVVTTPLSLLAPGEIRLADLQAYTTVSGTSGQRLTTKDQNYNFGMHWKVSDKTSSGYDMYYRTAEAQPEGSSKTALTHSAYLRHVFTPIFLANTRVLRSETNQSNKGKEVAHTLTAALTGNYLDTFSQSLTYSGVTSTADQGDSTSHSLFVRHRADLYEGWSATVDCGRSWKDSEEEGKDTNRFIRTGTSLIPNKNMHFNLNYQVAWGTSSARQDSQRQSGNLQGFWVPLPTLSVLAELHFNDLKGETVDSTVSQSYTVGWSPFADGDLQFNVAFHQGQNTEGDRSRLISPTIRWDVARGVLASLEYSTGTTDSLDQSSEFDSITANIRVHY